MTLTRPGAWPTPRDPHRPGPLALHVAAGGLVPRARPASKHSLRSARRAACGTTRHRDDRVARTTDGGEGGDLDETGPSIHRGPRRAVPHTTHRGRAHLQPEGAHVQPEPGLVPGSTNIPDGLAACRQRADHRPPVGELRGDLQAALRRREAGAEDEDGEVIFFPATGTAGWRRRSPTPLAGRQGPRCRTGCSPTAGSTCAGGTGSTSSSSTPSARRAAARPAAPRPTTTMR